MKTLTGHTAAISNLCFSPDGNTLASGCEDGTVLLWDIDSSIDETALTEDNPFIIIEENSEFQNRASQIRQFLWNDPDRADGHKEAVCLSISFPNYQMFYSIRESEKTKGVKDSQWVILLLDPKVLWELDGAFCQRNAAHKTVSSIPLEDRRKPEALKGMFEDFYNIRHQDLQIPDPYLMHPKAAYPTHPQAEVLVFAPIPVQFIKAIHFWHETTLEKCRNSSAESYSQMLSVNQQYFTYRTDYEVWRLANFNSEGIPLSYFNGNDDNEEIDRHPDINDNDIPF